MWKKKVKMDQRRVDDEEEEATWRDNEIK